MQGQQPKFAEQSALKTSGSLPKAKYTKDWNKRSVDACSKRGCSQQIAIGGLLRKNRRLPFRDPWTCRDMSRRALAEDILMSMAFNRRFSN